MSEGRLEFVCIVGAHFIAPSFGLYQIEILQ